MIEVKVPMIPGKKPGIVGKININVGEKVKKDQILCSIETAKGNRQIKASADGYIKEILVEEGQEVTANEVLILLDENLQVKTDTNAKIIEKDLLVIGAGPG